MPDQRFGMTEAFWLPEEATDLGVGWERILFYWREIQPSGPDDWNTLHVREEWLDEAKVQGRQVVGLLKNTAPWASEDGTEAGVPKGLYLPTDDPGNLWAQYVRRIAAYYGPRNIHHWIVWNEPEIRSDVYGHEFAGSISDYYQLLKVTYIVIKEIDPEATIHLAGLTWWHDQNYLGELFALMAEDPEGPANDYFFDVISLHIYFRSETMKSIISSVQEVERQFGFDKPIWVNEMNAPPNQDPEWPVERPVFDVDLDQQAWFIVQAFSLGFGAGAESISVYKLIDIHLPPGGESFGVVRPDLSRRPAYSAYQLATTYLAGFSTVNVEQYPMYYLVSFDRPSGITHVAWTRTASAADVKVPAKLENAMLIDMTGQREKITHTDSVYDLHLEGARCAGECIIGGPPVFIVEGDPGQDDDSASEHMNLDSVTRVDDSDAANAPPGDPIPLTPTLTVTPQQWTPQPTGEGDIINGNEMDEQTSEATSQYPTSAPPTGDIPVSDTDAGGLEDGSASTIGLWVIGLAVVLAAGLVFITRSSQSVD